MYKYAVILFSILTVLSSQEIVPEITEEKQRLLILPAVVDDNMESVGLESAAIVADAATSLGRFDVIDRNDLESILEEQSLQLTGVIDDDMVVEIGQITSAHEALVIKVLNFYQQGVPPEDNDDDDDDDDDDMGLFGKIVLTIVEGAVENALKSKEKDSDPYPHNIQTTLSVQVKKIDIESGQSIDSFTIQTGHTGGNRGRSRAVAMAGLQRQVMTKLKQFYTLTSEVLSVDGREVLLFLGTEIGVKTGTLFEIVKPDKIKSVRGKEIVIPGKRVGIVEVMDSSVDANRSIILRNWSPMKEGYRALEYTKIPAAFTADYIRNSDAIYSGLGLGLMINPINSSYFGANIRLAGSTDSYNDDNFTLGFGGYGGWRFLRTSHMSLNGRIGLDIDLPFRNDDEKHNVTAGLLSASIGLEMEFLMSKSRDFVLGAGYRFGGSSTHWTYSVESDKNDDNSITKNADWDNDPPKADISGLFFTVGMKFLSF